MWKLCRFHHKSGISFVVDLEYKCCRISFGTYHCKPMAQKLPKDIFCTSRVLQECLYWTTQPSERLTLLRKDRFFIEYPHPSSDILQSTWCFLNWDSNLARLLQLIYLNNLLYHLLQSLMKITLLMMKTVIYLPSLSNKFISD